MPILYRRTLLAEAPGTRCVTERRQNRRTLSFDGIATAGYDRIEADGALSVDDEQRGSLPKLISVLTTS